MNETDNRPAVVGQVEPTVRPAAWMLRHLLDPQQKPWPTRADSDAYKLAAGRSDFECTPLYDQAALDTLAHECARLRRLLDQAAVDLVRANMERAQIVAAERERCAKLCETWRGGVPEDCTYAMTSLAACIREA